MYGIYAAVNNHLSVKPMLWHSNGLTLSYTFLG